MATEGNGQQMDENDDDVLIILSDDEVEENDKDHSSCEQNNAVISQEKKAEETTEKRVEEETEMTVEEEIEKTVEEETEKTVEETTEDPSTTSKHDLKLEDNSDYEDIEETREKVDDGFSMDDFELLELTLPQQTVIRDKALKVWNSRKLIVYPIRGELLSASRLSELQNDEHCVQFSVHFEREKGKSDNWIGILDLVFDSIDRTKQAVQQLKEISSEMNILNAANVQEWQKDFDESRSYHFSSFESKKWPSCLVCVKYLPQTITEEKLREIFPEAYDVMLYMHDRPVLTETQRHNGFLFFPTSEQAEESVRIHNEKKTSVDGTCLAFFKYDRITHPQNISPNFLMMSERYAIMKNKMLVEKLAKIRGGHCAAVLDKFNSKLKDDESARRNYGLSTPTFEDMQAMPNLKILQGEDLLKVLKREGLVWRNRDRPPTDDTKPQKPPVQREKKSLPSDIKNQFKRKHQRMTTETNTVPKLFAPQPSLLRQKLNEALSSAVPPKKLMRYSHEPQYNRELQYTSFGDDDFEMTDLYSGSEIMGQAPLVRRLHAPAPSSAQQSSLLRHRMGHPLMMPHSAVGLGPRREYQELESSVASRLLSMAHASLDSSNEEMLPQHLTAPAAYGRGRGGTGGFPARPAPPFSQHFTRPAAHMKRGGSAARARPMGRAGWAAHQ